MPPGPKIAFLALILGLCSAAPAGAAQSRSSQTRQSFDGSFWTRPPGEKPLGPPLDGATPCSAAGASPLCALKTYLACVLYDAPPLCAAVGLDKVPERYAGPDT